MMVTNSNADNFDTPLEYLNRCDNIATRRGIVVLILISACKLFNAQSLLMLELVLGNRTPSFMQRRCKCYAFQRLT